MGLLSQTLDAARKALDMSREARMARAREMGFDTEQVWYHGAIESFDEFDPDINSRGAVYFTQDPETASWFAKGGDGSLKYHPNAAPNVIMANVSTRNTLEVDADELYRRFASDDPFDISGLDWDAVDDFVKSQREEGYDSVLLRDVRDYNDVVGDQLAVFDPSNIRSVNAAFDPAQRDSSNLLAGVGGATVGAGLLAAPQESEAAPMGTLAKLARMRTREAWHGSPHTYDQVDLSHMGSGEGAQAYGAGYYAADAREVAEQYRDDLGRLYGRGSTLDGEDIPTWIVDEVEAGRGDKVRADFERRKAEALSRANLPNAVQPHIARMQADNADKILRQLDALESGARAQPASALYRLEIPDEDLLDWDAPLSEQPEGVKAAFRRYAEANPQDQQANVAVAAAEGLTDAYDGMTGSDFYARLRDQPHMLPGFRVGQRSDQAASDYLSQMGIPGIRYLDGMSRNAGEGTRNYVVFDDANVNVVERNGQPVEALPRGRQAGAARPAAMGAAGAAAGAGFLAAPQESEAAPNTVGSVTTVPPMYAPSAAQRERAIRAEEERLLREHARASQGDTIEAPRYPWLAAAADWAGSQQLPGVPLYDQPLAGTAETLNRLAYGDYRPGGHGLGTLAMDSLMTGLEVVDPGTWAAVAAPEPRRMSPAEAAAERFRTARRGKRSAYKASVRKDP